MAEKILNTRILLKYDTYANWTTNNPVLKQGEMAIATVPTGTSTTPAMANLPNIVLKVGDGTSHYNDLKFISALAADVHSWAKAADKPEYSYNEITGLEDELARVSAAADTDTQYNLVATDAANYKYELRSKEKSAVEWTKVADLDLSGIVSRVAALEAKFVGMTEATVVAHVQAKIEGLDMAAAIEAGEGEIVYYVNEADGVVEAKTRALVAADIPTIEQSQVNGLPKALEDINTAIGNAQSGSLADAKAYTDTQLKNKVESLDYNGGEFGEHKFVTKVTEEDGVVAAVYAQPEIADVNGLETRLADIEGDVTDLGNNKQDNLGFEGEYNKETNKVVTMSALTAAIQDLDSDGAGFGDHLFVTKVTETDGIVTPVYAQPVIADIDGLTDRLSGIDGEIAKKQDALTFTTAAEYPAPNDSDNRVATEKFVLASVADLNGAMHFVGKLDAVPEGEANNAYGAGDVILVGYDEYVFDGTTWQPLGNESIYQLKADAETQHEALTQLVTNLESKHDSEMDALEKKHDDELAALDAAYKKAIADLDKDDAAVEGQFVTAVSEADGVITVTRAALKDTDIPELAQSKITGLVDKLNEIDQAIGDGSEGALADAKAYTDAQLKAKVESLDKEDTAVEKQFVTAVSEADGVITVTRAALKATDIPVIEQTQVNGLTDDLAAAAKAGTDAAAQALTDAKDYSDAQLKAKVESLDYTDTEVENNVVTAVSEADGVIAVTRKPLADVAWSGEVKDLKQTDTVLILNCGNSQVDTANEFVM